MQSWEMALVVAGLLALTGTGHAATLTVCGSGCDHLAIQEAIDAASDGDVVLVRPGTYRGNLDFLGKAITVASEAGPEETVIQANRQGSVVLFRSAETRESVLQGFTVRGGAGRSGAPGGGISCLGHASPTIVGNVIRNNAAYFSGGGIHVNTYSSPLIRDNTILGNLADYGGGIILIRSNARVENNLIAENEARSGGGGVRSADGSPTIVGNTFRDNTADRGGAIEFLQRSSGARVLQNLFLDNAAELDGGAVATPVEGPQLVNNTFAGNRAEERGSVLLAEGRVELLNNVIVASAGQPAIECAVADAGATPSFRSNDVFAPESLAFAGDCENQEGFDGNIALDPELADTAAGDYSLRAGSPAVDAGDGDTTELPDSDLAGNPRVIDGDGDGGAVIDLGAFELQPLHVRIAVRSGEAVGVVQPESRGSVAVTIFGEDELNVVEIDATSLRFGPDGAAPIHRLGDPFTLDAHRNDVDFDGIEDLTVHFRPAQTGISCESDSATLSGLTLAPRPIEGTAAIRPVGCRPLTIRKKGPGRGSGGDDR